MSSDPGPEGAPGLQASASDLELRLIDYAMTLDHADLSDRAVHQARRRIVDTMAGALAAYTAAPSKIARKLAVPVADGPSARVFGSLVATTPEMAAFANGTMVRFLDINDTYRAKDGSHPSDNLGHCQNPAEIVGRMAAIL
ncbi:MAG: MmgE/PrpD family protein, partial [Pseudomonadota bacterium]